MRPARTPLTVVCQRGGAQREGDCVKRRFDDAAGRLLLRWAVLLHRTVAGRSARERQVARRDAAIRAAYRRGVPVEQLAARMRLTPSWIRQVLNGRKPAEPPEMEEAA